MLSIESQAVVARGASVAGRPVQRWPIERLIPYANNPGFIAKPTSPNRCRHPQMGWTMPVLADEQGVLLAVMRASVRGKAGLKFIPVIVAHGWSEDEKRAYRVADNQLAARASWDPSSSITSCGISNSAVFDLDLIGFEPGRLEDILAGFGVERS